MNHISNGFHHMVATMTWLTEKVLISQWNISAMWPRMVLNIRIIKLKLLQSTTFQKLRISKEQKRRVTYMYSRYTEGVR
jgi:hypothetical protein